MNIKRWLSVLLAAVLLFAFVPAAAFADDTGFTQVYLGDHKDYKSESSVTIELGGGTVAWDAATATVTLTNVKADCNGIDIRPVDTSRTITVRVVGENALNSDVLGIYTTGNLLIEAEPGASLKLTATNSGWNAVYAAGTVALNGGTYDFKSDFPALASDTGIVIEGGANVVADSVSDTAVYTQGTIAVSGPDTQLSANANYCALLGQAGITIDGAKVTGHTTNDHPIYTTGPLTLTNADVTVTSDMEGATGLYVNAEQPLVVTGGTLNVTTDSTSLFSKGDISITDANVTINSGANPINAKGALTVDGANTVLNANGAYPVSGSTVEIKNGTVNVTVTDGTAISGENGVFVTGGTVDASTAAAMSAIYSSDGNIVFDGAATSVTASSAQDSAVFTRNGSVTLNAGTVDATAAEGFAAIVARKSEQDGTAAPENLILVGENYAVDGIVATTVWKQDSAGTFYSDTMIVPAGTQLTQDGLLPDDYVPTENNVVVQLKPADYTAVDAALAKVNALDRRLYTDLSAVDAAVAAVVRDQNITQQASVDAMAKAIEDALAALVKKAAPQIIAGANGSWKAGSADGLSFTSDALFADFLKVTVDGAEIAPANYTKAEGSTIVTLTKEYLGTLKAGEHTLGIVSVNGTAETKFTIVAAATSEPTAPSAPASSETGTTVQVPQTGDESPFAVWTLLAAAACVGAAGVVVLHKRREN